MSYRARARALRTLFGPRPQTREALRTFQNACLQDLVRHAYTRVPHYRRLLDRAGVTPNAFRGLADLPAIPPTERADLQPLPVEECCAAGWIEPARRVVRTSGSSGAPLTVRRTMAEERMLLAFRARAVGAFGLGLRTRRANIDHLSPEVVRGEATTLFYERLGVMPRLNLDWRSPKAELLAAIERFRPHVVSGPPSILGPFAGDLNDADRARITATRVITGAETLTPSMREHIERGFRLPLADVYGSHEVVFIAMEAPGVGGYRVCEEAVVVEVLRDGVPAKPGERGEVYVTALHSYAMPFLRYRLGDVVEVGEVAGPYATLRSIDGRMTDRFNLPDGRTLHGYALGEVVEAAELNVRRFQIVQQRRALFLVRLDLFDASPRDVVPLTKALEALLGECARVVVELVPTLDRGESRKFNPFLSVERLDARRKRGAAA